MLTQLINLSFQIAHPFSHSEIIRGAVFHLLNWVVRLMTCYPKGFLLDGFIQNHRGKRKKMKQLGAPEVVEADFEERRTYRRDRKGSFFMFDTIGKRDISIL